MSAPAQSRGLDRFSLRARLVVSLLLILALGLAATGLAATSVLRAYLSGRVDTEMVRVVEQLRSGPQMGPFRGRDRSGPSLPSRYQLTVLDADGTNLLQLNDPVLAEQPPEFTGADADTALRRVGDPYTLEADDGTPWRVLSSSLGGDRTLVVTTSLADVEGTIRRLRAILLAVDVVVLGVLAVVCLVAVRGSLRPLARIEETAGAIAGGDLSRRVPETASPHTEVGRLSRSLNGMLTQIERAFAAQTASEARMRRFVADASHELRTPLTSIRGFAELYRQGAVREPEEVARIMQRIEDESARMGGLVEDLLLLARLDEKRPLRNDPVDLTVLAADAVHDARAVANGRPLHLDLPDAGVVVPGDEARLRQVLANLVSNALRHTPSGTPVTVRVLARDGQGVLEVVDQGPGLDADQAARVFDRFYRADASRTRESGGGAGLGLSIVDALVHAHGGTVSVDSAPGKGATFRVVLPTAS